MNEQQPYHNQKDRLIHFFNREARTVPLGWEHPRDKDGAYITLMPRKWYDTNDSFNECMFMPDFIGIPDDQKGICAYETTSHTPISPVFPNTAQGKLDMAQYCVEHATVSGDIKCPSTPF